MTDVVAVMRAVCRRVIDNREYLGSLDAALGDGDHGVSMAKTFAAVEKRLDGLEGAGPATVLDAVGTVILTSVGGAMGPLFGSAFKAAASRVASLPVAPMDVASAILAARDAVAELGGAKVGHKTMLDALDVAATDAHAAVENSASAADVVVAAAGGAERGAHATVGMRAAVGRASRLGDRSIGTPDPGATSVAIILRAAADTLSTGPDTPSSDDAAGRVAGGGCQ